MWEEPACSCNQSTSDDHWKELTYMKSHTPFGNVRDVEEWLLSLTGIRIRTI